MSTDVDTQAQPEHTTTPQPVVVDADNPSPAIQPNGVQLYERTTWLAQHREVRTLFHAVATGRMLLRNVNLWPEAGALKSGDELKPITEHQKEAWTKATRGLVGILCGSPGTGKTTVIVAVIKALLAGGIVSANDICVAAPTGKASIRLTELLYAAGINIRARTWHSILGMGNADGEFKHNEKNPLPYKIMFGDESSMKDVPLMCAIFAARPAGCHFLLVGDINQLPPVGHGAPLRDLIAAGVPCGELTEIMRNSGGIVEACAAIRDGKPWVCGDNLKLLHDTKPEEQLRSVVATIHAVANRGLDPIWDCQVIVAVNAKSKVSRKVVNEALQDELNPDGYTIPGCPFRVGDKVVNLKNAFFPVTSLGDTAIEDVQQNDRCEVFVANGEIGAVVAVDEKSIVVKLSGPTRVVRVLRTPVWPSKRKGNSGDGGDSVQVASNGTDNLDESTSDGDSSEATSNGDSQDTTTRSQRDDDKTAATGCTFQLAFSISCHAGQGSEFPVCIVVLDDYPGARQICDRSWLYTGISRGKQMCVLVGTKATADAMCRRVNIGKRKTFLRELVLRGLAERSVEDL